MYKRNNRQFMCPMTKLKSSLSLSSSSYQSMQQQQQRQRQLRILPLSFTLLMLFISTLLAPTINAFQTTTSTISLSVPNRKIILPIETIKNQKYNYCRYSNSINNKNNNERIKKTTILSSNRYQHTTTKLYALPVAVSAIATTTSTTTQWILSSLINVRTIVHADPIYCLMMILLISTAGIQLERKTLIGKALSAPLVTMAIALLFANVGNIIPFESTIYTMINTYLIPLAVPMLLYDSNIQRIIKDTGVSILLAFFIGSFATIIGTIIAYPLVPMISLSSNSGWKVACALAARHIGGAINFIAVADTLNIPSTVVSAAIAADNVVVALYFTFLFAIAIPGEQNDSTATTITATKFESEGDDDYTIVSSSTNESSNEQSATTSANANNAESITLSSLGISLSVATVLVFIGKYITKFLLPIGTSSLPITSLLTVIGATIFSKTFINIRKSGTTVGIILIQMFFAASGASGSIKLVLQQAPTLFLFSLIQIVIHFIVLITIGKYICKIPTRELYLSSNANIGGPTTAAAMAQAKNWTSLIIPSLLIGIVGYATATSIALILLGPIIQRLPTIHTIVLPKLLLLSR